MRAPFCKRCNVEGHDGRSRECPRRAKVAHVVCYRCNRRWLPTEKGAHRTRRCPTLLAERATAAAADAYGLGRQLAACSPRETSQCPKAWSPAFDRGFVDGSGEIPRHHLPWRLFPVELADQADEGAAYARVRDGRARA